MEKRPFHMKLSIVAILANVLLATIVRAEDNETGAISEAAAVPGKEAPPVSEASDGEAASPEAAAAPPDATSAEPVESEAANETSSSESTQPDEENDDVIEEVEPVIVSDDGFFPTAFDGDAAVRRDRGVNVLTARTIRKKALLLLIEHRPYQSLFSGEDVFFDYLGFDSGNLKVALGLRYGILDALDVGFTRLSDGGKVAFDTYEFNARYAFLSQEKHQIDAAVIGGVTWFAQKDAKDAAGGFGQLFIDRVFFDMLFVGVGFAFHSESSSDVKSTKDSAFSGAVEGLVEWRMIDRLALTAEVAANVFGYGEKWPALSFAVKVLTNRHVFSLILTNTQFILADGIVANSWRAPSDWVFGFQIIREFDF